VKLSKLTNISVLVDSTVILLICHFCLYVSSFIAFASASNECVQYIRGFNRYINLH